jgi:DNA-binding IclR family transcriptional regulator
MSDYTNAAQQRLLRIVLALFGDVVNGYTPGQLCRLTGHRPDATTRDLANLVTAGLAERDEDGRYRLTPRLPQQAVKVYAALGRAETRLGETRAAIHRSDDY